MSDVDMNPDRRRVAAALAMLPLGTVARAGAETQGQPATRKGRITSTTLVAYFSRSGNTRVIAGLLHRRLGADLFEVQPAAAYPDDYLETVAQARHERDDQFEPSLASHVPGIAAYDTVYLGFPIWGETAPPIIRSFLSGHELKGKRLIPFITHGGYGVGSSMDVLRSHAPDAIVKEPFVMEADQERRTMNQVDAWLKGG